MNDLSKLSAVELRPDRKLIDANFDSYKLSLNPLPSYKAHVIDGVFRVLPGEADLGYEKIRCLTLHNYLVLDPFNKIDVYYVDSIGCLRRYHIPLETHIEPPKMMFSLGSNIVSQKKMLPPSFLFPSASLCVVCDGFGTTFVLDTGLRSDPGHTTWKIMYIDEDRNNPSVILHAVHRIIKHDDSNVEYLDCLFMKFREQSNKKGCDETAIKVQLEWASLSKKSEDEEFGICEVKLFHGKATPTYAALAPDCTDLHLAASSPFYFKPAWDSEIDQEIDALSDEHDAEEPKDVQKPPYRWKQNMEDVIIKVDLPPGTPSTAIAYSLSSKHLNLAIRESKDENPEVILNGDLYLDADPECSSWEIVDNQLEVTLQKRIEGRSWLTVVEGDDRGEYEVDPEEAARVQQQLSHLTSETLNADSSTDGNLFNSAQLEDCDAYFDSTASLMRFDSNSNKFTHVADISSLRWLFSYQLSPGDFPAVVLRHDVDAVAWQPLPSKEITSKDKRSLWKHIATFNALGYVHASKTNLKFCSSPPDANYAAFCECQRRIYVYRQPTPLASSLRNRSSGTVVGKIAIQQVATLEGNDDILGFVVTNERMYVLTMNNLIVFKVLVDVGA